MGSDTFAARAVLFDWDGTLLDSFRADSEAYLEMFHALGIGWGMAELEKHYSPNWHRVYRAAGLPETEWERADQLWGAAYARKDPGLLPGAREVLEELGTQYTLGLVTSGNRQRVVQQLIRFDLERRFAVRVCSEDAAERKPNPAPLALALAQLNLTAESCVYVGDTPDDVEMARRAGIRAIAVLGFFPAPDGLRAAQPDALLSSIAELPARLTPLAKAV